MLNVNKKELSLNIQLEIIKYYGKTDTAKKETYKVVGYISDESELATYYGLAVAPDEVINTLMDGQDNGVYSYAMGIMPKDTGTLKKVADLHYDESGNITYSVKNSVTYSLGMVNSMLETMGQVFLYIGIGFAVFAAIMLSNFIATSISHKKVEIGILRAIGSRGNDVFRIFFAESFIVAMINFVLAGAATFVVTVILNSVIRNDYGILITILNFGLRQVGLLLLVSLGVAFIASFLPVKKIASKRPIDAIRNR